MKHIFYGKVIHSTYKLVEIARVFDTTFDKELKDKDEIDRNIESNYNKIGICVGVLKDKDKENNIVLSISDSITERVLENTYVKINGKEVLVEKVVQSDNGDVLCYTDKVVKEVVTEGSKEKAEELYRYYMKKREQVREERRNTEKETEIKNKKKWYEFWK